MTTGSCLRAVYFAFFAAFLPVMGPFAARAAADDVAPAAFFQSLPDLPLMPGMAELTGEGVVFDQPEGRIIEADAVLPRQDGDAVRSFYDRALPELGWAAGAPGTFARDGESLKMEVIPGDGRTLLRITVTPR